MANGFMPALLLTEKQVFSGIAPSEKITPVGYLNMLLQNGTPEIVTNSIENNGHTRSVTVKYRPRGVAGKSVTTDDCSIQASPLYKELALPSLMFRKNGTFLDDALIRKYEQEASSTVMLGKPAPPMGIMMEMWNVLINKANGILQDVDLDLMQLQASSFGVNTTTGAATAKAINFPLSTATNPLNQGMTLLETDIQENEIAPENAQIVGAGLINAVYRQIQNRTQNAGDQNYPANAPQFFWDSKASTAWGSNHFGVFEKGSVQFVNVNQFAGGFGGDKLSTWLFTLNLPLKDSLGNNELSKITFDAQLWYNKCPSELEIDGVVQSVGRGWILDLMINYNQFNIPSDAYDAADRLTGNNGTLHYSATNT